VDLALDRTALRLVQGWTEPSGALDGCERLRYQTARVTAWAVMADGRRFDASALVRLAVDDATILGQRRDDRAITLFAVADAGSTRVRAVGPNGVAALSSDVVVSIFTHPTAVIGLAAFAVVPAALRLSLALAAAPGLGDTLMATATVPTVPTLRFEGDEARVMAVAVFDDLSCMEVTPEMGLRLSAASPDAVEVGPGPRTVRVAALAPSKDGPLATAQWVGAAACGDVAFATGPIRVRVDLPAASSATVTGVPPRMALPTDAAAFAGVPVDAEIHATLVYEAHGGRTVDATADPRTVYDTSLANGVFEVLLLDSGRRMISARAPGLGFLLVRFAHQPTVSANVSVHVTAFASLRLLASPFPAYPGSDTFSVLSLAPIAATSPPRFQSALLRMTMWLLDGHMITLDPSAIAGAAEYVAFEFPQTGRLALATSVQVGCLHLTVLL